MSILSKRNLSALLVGSALISSITLAGTAFAAEEPTPPFHRPIIVGTVAGIAGTTLTVDSKAWPRAAQKTETTYTVQAAQAAVTKEGVNSTLSAIAVGDRVMVEGTLSGTTVTATAIRDGRAGHWGRMFGEKPDMDIASHTPAIIGNGQPVIGGTVTAKSDTSLTVTNKSNVTYTVDTSSAKVTKTGFANATSTNITIGDTVIVQGTVQGTAVTATSIIDSGTLPATTNGTTPAPVHRGLFGLIGGFFSHMFGFF